MKILIVEDDELSREVISEMISVLYPKSTAGIAANGIEAFEMIKDAEFDLVLSDVDMPHMNGSELVKNIRKELRPDMPVIAVTAYAVVGDRERFLLSGFTDYISKPLQMERLKEVVDRHFPQQ